MIKSLKLKLKKQKKKSDVYFKDGLDWGDMGGRGYS